MSCKVHRDFFEESCEDCRQEYLDMKGVGENPVVDTAERKYKALTEERAKKLYEELMLQYLKTGLPEMEADRKAKAIVRNNVRFAGSHSGRGCDYFFFMEFGNII